MSINYEWHDVVGNAGLLCIVGSYFWMQIGRMSGQSPSYSLINAIGATLILISLYYDFNLSAALLEFFWLIISLLGLVISFRRRSRKLP